ncbi:MAG TPA: Ku protein, partial [Polyangiaceae bacterium]|nr:Ku protein [Polyangiaceae bacterium]
QSVSFNQLHKKCGGRLKQQLFCPVDNEVVQRTDIVKGFEFQKDRYVQFTEEELKKLEAERTDRIDIVEFVPADTVDFVYIEKTQYLGPDKGGDRAYRLLSEAMTRMNKIAVGRYGTRGKETLVLIRPHAGGLVLHQVFYADEVRSFDDVDRPGELEFKPIEAELADKLIEQLSAERFRPEQYHDDYRDRVMAAVEQKAAGAELTVMPEAPQAQIIDLFEALKRSLKSDEEPKADSGDKPEVKKVAPKREPKKKEATG